MRKGFKLTEATKEKIRQSHLGVPRPYMAGVKNPFYGKKHTEIARAKMSQVMLGRKHFCTPHTKEAKLKMRLAKLGKKHTESAKEKVRQAVYKQWQDREWADRQVKLISQGANRKQNTPETLMLNLLNTYFPNEWEYVGDGAIIIDGLNPDFINSNGKKQIIEVFGDYWHGQRARNYRETEQGRIEAYAKYGFSTLVIWQSELRHLEKVIEKVGIFCEKTKTA